MHIIHLSQQVGWFDGNIIDLHTWGLKINSHRWHGLWSKVGCWLNIPYLCNQFQLSVYYVDLGVSIRGGLPSNLNLSLKSNLGNNMCRHGIGWNQWTY